MGRRRQDLGRLGTRQTDRECVNHLLEALQTIKEKLGEASVTGYDIEAVYKAGHEAVRATTSGWTSDVAVAFMQGGQFKWGSDDLLLQPLGQNFSKELQAIRARKL